MYTDLDRNIAAHASDHHGVFDLRVVRSMRPTKDEIYWRLRREQWLPVYQGVFRLAGVPPIWRGDLLAACLAGGPRAVASHRSAAELWGFPGRRTDLVEITCPRWRRGQEAGPVVHESKALDPADCTVVDNIPVTSPELTLLMLGAVCAPVTVEMALDVARNRELVTYESVRAVLRRVARRGRNGAGVLRAILDERSPEVRAPESPMETKMLRLLRQLGFAAPVPQYEVWHEGRFYGRLDAAWPDKRVGVEYESYEFHTGKVALVRTSNRRDAFEHIDWRVIGCTAEDLKNRGLRLAPLLHDALSRPLPRFGVKPSHPSTTV
jgi:hypothetical protein